MQENNAEKQRRPKNDIAVQCARLHLRGHAQTMINPLSLKDYKRPNRYYTLNDSLLDSVIVVLNLLRGYDQRAPFDLKVSSQNQNGSSHQELDSTKSSQYITPLITLSYSVAISEFTHTCLPAINSLSQITPESSSTLLPHLPYSFTTINKDLYQFSHITTQPNHNNSPWFFP